MGVDLRGIWRAASLPLCIVVALPAFASDTPLYQPAPAWVIPATMPVTEQASTDTPPIIIYDLQQRIEDGRLWSYVDGATKISSPEMLSQAATLTLPWMPDKGDLIIHEVSIQRGAQRIDLLAKGQKFTLLRREEMLERRELTGILTATMAVEGLQVGDILRLRFSTTSKDEALGGRVQTVVPMLAAPARVGVARIRLSWRNDAPPHWKASVDGINAKPVKNGNYTDLTIALPIAKQPEMPTDAPNRYLQPPLLELTTFADWADVSRTFAPLYATNGEIAPGSALADEVDHIMTADATPLGRAERALELVQDKIRYLAIGMDGGNYVPQKPTRTWEVRYGDCKAKTVLLLALLRAMNIEAEPVIANVGAGDAVPGRLPSAAAFNHVLVRATIGGETLWLDGTRTGSRLIDIHDTPALGYVLPLRAAGATLLKVETHANARPMIDMTIDADESLSVDLPSAFEVTAILQGPVASMFTLAKNNLAEKEQREGAIQFVQGFTGGGQFSEGSITPDPTSGTVTIKARGIASTNWITDDRRRKRAVARLLDQVAFDPDRSKATWATIPVAAKEPMGIRYRLRLRLPDGGRGFAMEGVPDVKKRVAGFDIARSTTLTGGLLTLDERIDSVGGEIAASNIPIERDAFATAKAQTPRIVAPMDTRHRWDIDGTSANSSQLKSIEDILAKAIANDAEESSGYYSRAVLRIGIGDRRGAIGDLTHAIAIAPSIDNYLKRSSAYYELGDLTAALADAESARALDPASIEAIGRVGQIKAERGDLTGTIALLDQRIALGGSTRNDYLEAKADLIGEFGDPKEALALYDRLVAEKPGSPSLMNGRCWTEGTRSVTLDTALKDCTKAIELSSDTAAALDSRALVWYRLGKYDDALTDLDAALAASPDQAGSRFMRAMVLSHLHRDVEAAKELAIARRLMPSVDRKYARYGIKP